MPPSSLSNLKVSIAWDTPTTYAGEELRCTITFRNTAQDPSTQSRGSGHSKPRPAALLSNGRSGSNNSTGGDWSGVPTPRSGRASIALSDTSKRPGHRQTVSLNAPSTRRLSSVPNTPTINEHVSTNEVSSNGNGTRGSRTPKHSHKRSISIISHGSVEGGSGGGGGGGKEVQSPVSPAVTSPRKSPHARAASYHGTSSKGPQGANGMLSPKINGALLGGARSPRGAPALVRAATAGAAKTMATDHAAESRSPLLQQTNEEEEGETDSLADETSAQASENASLAGRSVSAPLRQRPFFASPLPHREKLDNTPLQRVISPIGTEATPRSSIDLVSNFSEDTFASEYIQPGGIWRFAPQRHSRQVSNMTTGSSSSNSAPAAEHLMMGYVQLQGSFILDGSLVDLSPFEEVKQMGVIGGQGSGGVVGIGTPKRNSGLLSSFGLSSLGSSFGGILGGQEMSSMRDMKGMASTRSIPLISTPQSILFVDLELRPGQSRSFTYRHQLPQDLPPTHKGRAIKIEYQLTIGTQRAQTVGQKNNMRQVEIPFRVFPAISSTGSLLPHDLMEPHVLLRDQAVTKAVNDEAKQRKDNNRKGHDKHSSGIRTKNHFIAYTEQLLQSALDASGEALLSPTEARRESRVLLADDEDPFTPLSPSSAHSHTLPIRDLIDQFVTRPALSAGPNSRSASSFAIQRAGSPVATITLVRPAYRLGDVITAVIDLTPAASHIFALHASLESEELVAERLALRSATSIRRATRRVHAHASESTASQRRAVFRFMVPWTATPDFRTDQGVSLEWKLRVEFICSQYPKARIQRQGNKSVQEDQGSATPRPRQGSSASSRHATAGGDSHRKRPTNTTDNDDDDDDDDEEEEGEEYRQSSTNNQEDDEDDEYQEGMPVPDGEELLEEVHADERGTVLAALQEVHCESFEVGVPVRVFGADGGAVAKLGSTISSGLSSSLSAAEAYGAAVGSSAAAAATGGGGGGGGGPGAKARQAIVAVGETAEFSI